MPSGTMSAGSAAFRGMKGSVTRSRSISYLIYLDRTAKLKRTETKLCGNELFILYARSACFSLPFWNNTYPKTLLTYSRVSIQQTNSPDLTDG